MLGSCEGVLSPGLSDGGLPAPESGSRAAIEMRTSRLDEICSHFMEMEPPAVREALHSLAQRQLATEGENEGPDVRGRQQAQGEHLGAEPLPQLGRRP